MGQTFEEQKVHTLHATATIMFVGLALKRGGHTDTGPDMVLERPKVLHNLQTGNLVMWMHIDSPDYKWARVGVAVSKKPLGPFSFERSFQPHDQESRDFTVWQVLL